MGPGRPGPREERRGRDLNPRWTFPPIRDFQSRSLDRSDTSPRSEQGTARRRLTRRKSRSRTAASGVSTRGEHTMGRKLLIAVAAALALPTLSAAAHAPKHAK